MDTSRRVSLSRDSLGGPIITTVPQTQDMAEVLQIKISQEHRESGESVFHGLHRDSCSTLPR